MADDETLRAIAERVRQKRLAAMNAPVDSAADRDRADERGASAKGKERAEPGPPPPAPDGPPRPPAKVAPPPPQSVSEPVKKSQPVVSPPKPSVSAPAKLAASPPAALALPVTQLAHRILTSSLLVSLESSAPVGYTALPFVGEELASEGLEPLLTSEQFERALVARLSLPSNTSSSETAIEYLLATYTRLQTHKKRLLSLSSNSADKEKVEERVAIVDRAVEVLLRWGVLVLDREMQGVMVVQNARGAEDGPAVLLDLLLANSLPQTFLEELAASAQSSESLPGLITPILVALAARFRALPPLGSGASPYPPLLGALQSLLAVKPIAATTPTLPAFNPPVPSKTIELVSLLGPYFSRLTPFPDTDPTVGSNLFASSTYGISDRAEVDEQGVPWRGRNAGEVKMAWLNLRSVLSSLEGSHHGLLLSLYRANRPATTTWILRILTENAARGKMQFDPLQVSSHGFMYALYRSHLKLCDPFAEGLTKVNGPDPIPLFSDEAWAGIAGETRIVSDKSGADAYAAELRAGDRGEASFVTSVFHTTLSFAHLGPLSTIRIYTAQLRDIGELSRHVARLTRERDSGAWDNPAGELQKAMLKRFEGQLDKMIGEKLASDAALLDPEFLRHVLRFLDFQMAWLVRVAVESCGGNTQGVDWNAVMRGEVDKVGGVELANMGEPSGRWTCLPEWVLDDVCEWYTFITHYNLTLFESHPTSPIVTFSLLMLLNPPLIRNPYLKAKFVDILFSFTRPMYQDRDGTPIGKLDAVFTTNPMAKANLVRVLTRFFVDVEQTGMHTQFYDKFNIRYNISQILKTIWEIPAHRSQMISMARDHEFFVRFVNLLMNDTTYLLDESIGKLIEIRNIQMEMADIGWQGRTNEHRAEREQTLRSDERQATSYLALGNETLHMLQYLTSEPAIVEPFMAPEVVDRLAAMMDFNLAALVGPRCTELKVKNPDKYRFDPKRLLSELVRTYLHLVKRNEFIAAVAKDGRSYAKRHFVRAAGILTRNRLAGEGDIQELMEFVGKVEGVLESEKAEEEDLGEAPDEFLDPIMFHLMEDPVILPGSRTTVDRTTIRSHLLSDAHDPFNRQPLKFEDVIPDTELKQRIDEWKASRMSRKREKDDPMDTA